MLTGFQQYLVDKGFKRTCTKYCSIEIVENYTSEFLSTYGLIEYQFTKDEKFCYWGLIEDKKPPVMFLGTGKLVVIQNKDNHRTTQDGYRILFSKWHQDRFDEIYEVFMSGQNFFAVDCTDEKNITIEIIKHANKKK